MNNAVFTVRLPDDVKSELDKLAKATNRSRSYLATKAIADYVRRNAWQVEELQQAAREADEGEFVSDEAVSDWLDTWGTENEMASPKADTRVKNKP